MSETGPGVAVYLRRQWLVLVVAAAMGALTAGAVAAARPVVTTSTTRVIMETRIQTEFSGVPVPDSVATSVRSSDAIEAIARRAGTTAPVVSAGLKVTLVPAPQSGVDVSYRSVDPALAKRVAAAAAEEARNQARLLSADLITQYSSRVSADERALGVLEGAAKRQGAAEDTELQFRLWTVRQSMADDAAAFERLTNAYRPGTSSTSTSSPLRAGAESAAAGAVAGLLAGAAIAWWREWRATRA
ncbi:MAG: hypothetical protein Q7W30_01570 [Coriobacteriia bacterium]|nr:hypothetical protein [Coriobacteriia bacterium]